MDREQMRAAVCRVLTAETIGESVHTALRKCDAVTDQAAYNAIQDMPDEQWHAAMAWVADVLVEYVERELRDGAS